MSRGSAADSCKPQSVMYIVDTKTPRSLCDADASIQGLPNAVWRGFREALFGRKRVGL